MDSKRTKTITVAVVERGSDPRCTLCMDIDVLSDEPGFDLTEAVRDACAEYVATGEGAERYEALMGIFAWADFAELVPDAICRKHGFSKGAIRRKCLLADADEKLAPPKAFLRPTE